MAPHTSKGHFVAAFGLMLGLAGCEQIIGANFDDPAEIKKTSTGGTSEDNPDYENADAFCAAFAAGLCQATVEQTCWSTGNCKEDVTASCKTQLGSNRGYLSPYAKDCVSRTAQIFQASAKLPGSSKFSRANECRKAFGRFAKEDEPCETDNDCTDIDRSFAAPEVRCMVTGYQQRTCLKKPPSGYQTAEVDQYCQGAHCSGENFCDGNQNPPKCAPQTKTDGSSCSAPDACDRTENYDFVCLNGTCRNFIAPGSSSQIPNVCQDDRECNGSYCVQGACVNDLLLKPEPNDPACGALRGNPMIGTL